MLAGEQPFPGNNVTSILYKLVHVEPVQPANLEMNGLVPQKWHEVFGRVLAAFLIGLAQGSIVSRRFVSASARGRWQY